MFPASSSSTSPRVSSRSSDQRTASGGPAGSNAGALRPTHHARVTMRAGLPPQAALPRISAIASAPPSARTRTPKVALMARTLPGSPKGGPSREASCVAGPRERVLACAIMSTEAAAGRATRLASVREAMGRHGASWLLVAPCADFRWLTGAVARSTERLVLFALPVRGEPFCLVPRLEADALAGECPWLELEVWDEHEDPFARLTRRVDLDRRPATLVSDGLRTATLLRLAAATACRPAALALEPLRAVKDAAELASLATAAEHADRVV